MRLLRFATVSLSAPAPAKIAREPYTADTGVRVEIIPPIQKADDITGEAEPAQVGPTVAWPYEHEAATVLLMAMTPIEAPGLVQLSGDSITIPADLRHSAERALQEYADMLAVVNQCKRSVRSPRPCVILEPQNDEERDLLSRAERLEASPSNHPTNPRLLGPTAWGPLLYEHLSDRMDGLGLLADALAAETTVGRARELFRLFERAFRRGPADCVTPLFQFLLRWRETLGFTREEIAHWLTFLRSISAHADRREEVARGDDLAPFIARIEFAAYDVLLNKKRWRHGSAERRDAVQIRGGPGQAGAVLFDPRTVLTVSWMDPYSVFRIDWRAQLTVPDGCLADQPQAR